MLPSPCQDKVGHHTEVISELNTQPGLSPVNASPCQLPVTTHHSGPRRLAKSYLVRNFHSLQSSGFCWRTLTPLFGPAGWKHSKTPKLDVVSLRPQLTGRVSNKAPAYLQAAIENVGKSESSFGCSLNGRHKTGLYIKDMTVKLYLGPACAGFIYGDLEGQRTQFVSPSMANALKASPLRGYRLVELKQIDYSNVTEFGLTAKTFPLFELQFRGKPCRRSLSIVGAQNACPHCGRAPLICPECGCYEVDCPDCGQAAWVVAKNHKGHGDKRLLAAGWKQWSPMIIDVNRWDGSDFIFVTTDAGLETNVVTKRAIDWLQRIHAAPFIARPVQARLDGATADQLDMLKAARFT